MHGLALLSRLACAGLVPGTSYVARVRVRNASGWSGWGSKSSVIATLPEPQETPGGQQPAATDGVGHAGGGAEQEVDWERILQRL